MNNTAAQIKETQRLIGLVEEQIRTLTGALATAIAGVNAKTQRAGGVINFAGSGTLPFDLVWTTPFPDTSYGIWVTLISSNPAQVHWTYALVNKTTSKVTISVVAASGVGDVVIDGLAVRTT